MTVRDTLQVLRRRRAIVIPLVVLTVVGAAIVFLVSPKRYEAESSLVVLAPTVVAGADVEGPVNPFLNFGGSQVTAAEVLAVRMGDVTVLDRLEEAGVTGVWTFEVQGATGPLAVVTVEGSSVEEVTETTEGVVEEAQAQFRGIQLDSGSPEDQLVRLDLVSSPDEPDVLTSGGMRNALALLGAGLIGTVLLAFAAEGVSRSRARKAAEDPEARDDSDDVSDVNGSAWSDRTPGPRSSGPVLTPRGSAESTEPGRRPESGVR